WQLPLSPEEYDSPSPHCPRCPRWIDQDGAWGLRRWRWGASGLSPSNAQVYQATRHPAPRRSLLAAHLRSTPAWRSAPCSLACWCASGDGVRFEQWGDRQRALVAEPTSLQRYLAGEDEQIWDTLLGLGAAVLTVLGGAQRTLCSCLKRGCQSG